MTQPREEVCDLGGAGSGACETQREPRGGRGGFGGGVAVQWRCHLPDRDVTQVAGHREPAIEQMAFSNASNLRVINISFQHGAAILATLRRTSSRVRCGSGFEHTDVRYELRKRKGAHKYDIFR